MFTDLKVIIKGRASSTVIMSIKLQQIAEVFIPES